MTRSIRLGAVALVLCLPACGDRSDGHASEEGASVSRDEVASRARDFVKPQPGLYRSTVEIIDFNIPGAPPQVAEMMRKSSNFDRAEEYCLTPAEVEKGFEESIRKSQQGDCDYRRFDVDGGQIEAAMTCTNQGRSVDLELSGKGDSTSSEMAMTMTMDMGGMGEGTIRARSRSERIGNCPA